MNFFRKIFKIREFNLFLIVLVVIIILIIRSPFFATKANMFGVLSSMSTDTIIAGAMTILFISGGFDLSVGSTLGLCAMIVAMLVKAGTPIPLAVAITILIGIAIGGIMGYIIAYIKINPFIVTLAGFLILRSLHLIISGGTSIGNLQKPFALIARFKILNVPMYIIFAFFSILVFDALLRNNVFFRNNYNLGGDENSASLLGINVKRLKLFNYCLTSAMASVAGIFLVSKFNNANIEGSPDTAFQVITAVILGGASLKGGRGSVTGTLLGLCIMALIENALVLFGLNILWNKVAIGLVLIIVVVLDSTMNRRTIRK